MNTLIVTEVRIFNQNGKYYCSESFSKILERYCKKFGNISILTRIIEGCIPKGYTDISRYKVKFINSKSIFNSINPFGKHHIKECIKKSNFIILRVPSIISIYIYRLIKKYKKLYMTEVMGCAWDAYWNHDLIGKFIAPFGFFKMKKIVYNANYCTYVTNAFLQNRYPCKNKSIGVSNVNIDYIYQGREYISFNAKKFSMLTAAAIDVRYKGQQYVIKAIAILKKKGINITYYLAGGGNKKYLKNISRKYNVEDNVIFLGNLPHKELINYMHNVDFYIQPSLQEGLPRSVIEAMSCGCICLGSKTAGIPELLNSEQVFKRKSVNSIVKAIESNIKYKLSEISYQNINKSKEYISEKLNKKRYDFYDEIIKNINT